MKRMTTVRIDETLLLKAKKQKINLSQTLEEALKQKTFQNPEKTQKMAGPPGFEPGISGLEAQNVYTVDWQAFESWLLQSHRPRVASTIVNYAVRYAECLIKNDLSSLRELNDAKRRHVLTALSNLAKFLGVYKHFKLLVENYGVKWSGKSYSELFIQRYQRGMHQNLWDWALTVKQLIPRLGFYVDFIALTGLRLNEATESYRLIKQLHTLGKLNEYYDQSKMTLEHYKYPQIFLRKSKNTFISFLKPEDVLKLAEEMQPPLSPQTLINVCRRRQIQSRWSDLREASATIHSKYLAPHEVDFIQGRIGITVFSRHYYNPAYITDLRERVFKAQEEIVKNLTF
ncbi:MAG: type II toxin-antitoxin system CcdA family antitoxin [Candidatus Bathyarchaeia archaeon]